MKDNRFVINGKEYVGKDFDFNLVCDLEEDGISLDKVDKSPIGLVRAYMARCFGMSKEDAGREIQAHLVAGGKLDDAISVLRNSIEESDFFRALSNEGEQKEDPKGTPKAK